MLSKERVYLDYNATTPIAPSVFDSMKPYMDNYEQGFYGNPSSVSHPWGWKAELAVTQSRDKVGKFLGTSSQNVFFTSGASESNNWALRGTIDKLLETNEKIHILTSPAEHKSVLDVFENLAIHPIYKNHIELELVPVNQYAQVSIEDVAKRIRPNTKLMSFMWANNETGSLNPVAELSACAHKHGVLFHCDATAAVGKVSLRLDENLESTPDLVSFSGHKIYGPKGIGVLYVRDQKKLSPLFFGGGQESGLRSGTLNVPGIIGMASALELASEVSEVENLRQWNLTQDLSESLISLGGVHLNSHPTQRISNTLSITFSNHRTSHLLESLFRFGLSASSACSSGHAKVSHVLKSIGLSDIAARSTLRVSIGRPTTHEDINDFIGQLRALIESEKTIQNL